MLPPPTLEDVRRFWNENPIYSGEARADLGTRDFFEEHAAMTLHEFSGDTRVVFVRGPGCWTLDAALGFGSTTSIGWGLTSRPAI